LNCIKTIEKDKDLGILWKDIRIVDVEGNYIIFRQYSYLNKNNYIANEGKIDGVNFSRIGYKEPFRKCGKGRIKKTTEIKMKNIVEWAIKNIEDKIVVEELHVFTKKEIENRLKLGIK